MPCPYILLDLITRKILGLKWIDQVEEDLKKIKARNWREKCKNRRLWNEIVKRAKTHQGL
jgi:hypothetical protein